MTFTMCSKSGSNKKKMFCFNLVDWDPKNMLCYCNNCWKENCSLCHQDNAHLQFFASTKYGRNSTNFLDTRSLSQPYFEGSVKMKLTLSKLGLGRPPGLPKFQSSIAKVKTLRIGVFFISLES
jgi:hypothetical protein